MDGLESSASELPEWKWHVEADAVVIIDVPQPGSLPYLTQADLYVACSRAKHLLTILPDAPNIIQL